MNKDTKEKICAFYASDYHFEMITLPYINKKIENDEEIFILTQNNLEDTMKNLLERINFKDEKKEEILKLNWRNEDLEKFKTIKSKIDEKRKIIIFVKGKENYIHNVNQNIDKWFEEEDEVKIINCYDIEEVGLKLNDVMGQYKKVLKTSGEKEI